MAAYWAPASAAISAWLTAVTGYPAVRANLNVKRPTGRYLTYLRTSGALPQGPLLTSGVECPNVQDRVVTVTVDTPAPGSVSIDLIESGVRTTYSYTNAGGENSQDMRDGLLAELAAAAAVVADDGDARLTITGDFGYENESGCTAVVNQDELLVDRYTPTTLTLSVQSFVDAPAPDALADAYDPDAVSILETVVESLATDAIAGLQALDIEPMSATAPVDISQLIGTEIQGRAAVTITFRLLLSSQHTTPRLTAADDPAVTTP